MEYDSQAEISQEHIADEEVTEGTTVEEVAEETVEPEATEESQEIVTEESSQEELVTEESSQGGKVEDDACNSPSCERVVGKHVVAEEFKPMGTLEGETTWETETTDLTPLY